MITTQQFHSVSEQHSCRKTTMEHKRNVNFYWHLHVLYQADMHVWFSLQMKACKHTHNQSSH